MTQTYPSEMKTLQFESIKVALKQNKDGYILTLCIHPDDVPLDLLRDFVGAHYQVVMVRLNDEHQPMDRADEFDGSKSVRIAGILCKEKEFWEYLHYEGYIFDPDEKDATEWLRNHLSVQSRSELKTNQEARLKLRKINEEYLAWKKRI